MLKFLIRYLKYKYLLYVFALVAGWPCVFYLMGWLPDYTVNYVILFVLAGATALIKNAYRHVPKPIAIIISIQIFCWFFYTVFYQDSSYLTRVFLLFITLSILGIQLSYRDKYEFINTYNFWLVFQAVAGSIGFVLVFAGLLQPLSNFIQMDGRPGYFYGLFKQMLFLKVSHVMLDSMMNQDLWQVGVFLLCFSTNFILIIKKLNIFCSLV